MNKHTLKVAIISVISTLIVVGIVLAVAIPRVIDGAKTAAVVNFDDEYQEIAHILDESKDPVIQPNYIITGLIMSPDFQEYLDQGVQNGWWTEEFLEQFLIDEALPIFFTNYHGLFSLILGSEPVQELGDKITIIKAKVQEIITLVQQKVSIVINILHSPAVAKIKEAVGTLEANKAGIISLINTLQSIDFTQLGNTISKLQAGVGELQKVIDTLSKVDFNKIEDSIATITNAIENIDMNKVNDLIATLENIKDKLNAIDFEKIEAIILDVQTQINDINTAIYNLLHSEFADKVRFILDHIEITTDILQFIIDFVTHHFVSIEDDFDFNNPIKLPGKEPITDLEPLAPLLNAIELEIVKTYDDNGTKLNQKDDTLTITEINISFEQDKTMILNVLSKEIVIEGKDAFKYNMKIGVVNNQV